MNQTCISSAPPSPLTSFSLPSHPPPPSPLTSSHFPLPPSPSPLIPFSLPLFSSLLSTCFFLPSLSPPSHFLLIPLHLPSHFVSHPSHTPLPTLSIPLTSPSLLSFPSHPPLTPPFLILSLDLFSLWKKEIILVLYVAELFSHIIFFIESCIQTFQFVLLLENFGQPAAGRVGDDVCTLSSLINLLNQFWVQLVLVVTWCCY